VPLYRLQIKQGGPGKSEERHQDEGQGSGVGKRIGRIKSRRKRAEVHPNNDRLCAFLFVSVRRKATESRATRRPWEAERVNEGLVQHGENLDVAGGATLNRLQE
jgi:hypothetical protein